MTITSAFRHPRPIAARLVRTLFLVTLAAIVLLPRAAVAVPDTTYINNAYTGSTVDGTITYPFKSILAALAARTGGPDRVFAVMGSNTPYRESITIADPDSGLAGHPFVLFARGAATIDGGDPPPDNSTPAETEPNWWTLRYADPTSTIKLWTAVEATANNDCDQVVLWSPVLNSERRYTLASGSDTFLTAIPTGKFYYRKWTDSVYVRVDDPDHSYYADGGYLCTRLTIRIRVPNVVVDGFTVLRSKGDGIGVPPVLEATDYGRIPPAPEDPACARAGSRKSRSSPSSASLSARA